MSSFALSREEVNLEFLEQIHGIMKAHSWYESPKYYQYMLRAYCKYFCSFSIHAEDKGCKIQNGLDQLRRLLEDIEALAVSDVQYRCILLAEKSRCWATLYTITTDNNMEGTAGYFSDAKACFEKLLNILSNLGKEPQDNCGTRSSLLQPRSQSQSQEFETLTSDIYKTTTHTCTLTSFLTDDTTMRFCTESLISIRSLLNVETISLANTPEWKKQEEVYSKDGGHNFSVSANQNFIRHAVLDLLCRFAKEGNLDETARLTAAYIGTISKNLPARGNDSTTQFSETTRNEGGRILTTSQKTFAEYMKPMRSPNNVGRPCKFQNITDDNQKWVLYMIQEIIKSARVKHVGSTSNYSSSPPEDFIYDQLSKFALSMEQLLYSVNISIEASFYAARIEGLFDNLLKSNQIESKIEMRFSSSGPRSQEVQVRQRWDYFLKNAFRIIDSVDESVGRNSTTYHAIITMLCNVKEAKALEHAQQVVTEMESEGCVILPEMWSALLRSATLVSTERELSNLLMKVESKIEMNSNFKSVTSLIDSLLLANARLKRGLQTLELFRSLRDNDGIINYKTYYWTVSALYHFRPNSKIEYEFTISKNPREMSMWFLNEMHKDGIQADEGIVRLLMKLYMKKCQMVKTRTSVDEVQLFVEAITTEGLAGHSRVVGTEEMYSDLIKAACLADQEGRALEILECMELWYGIKPTALSYEPIMYNYNSIKGSRSVAQNILTTMLNKKVQISANIVDSIVESHLTHGEDNLKALDLVQELYNMHNIRPSPSKLLDILDVSLHKRDIFEARRVVVVIKQMFESSELPGPIDIQPIHMVSRIKTSKFWSEPMAYRATRFLISDDAIEERFLSHGLQLHG